MIESMYLRKQAEKLSAVSHQVADTASKAALIEIADDLNRWADRIDDDDLPKSNGAD